MPERIMLGDTVRDGVTGFEGVATAVLHQLAGAPRIEVSPLTRSGKFVTPIWFNLGRVQRVSGVGGGQDVKEDTPTPGPTEGHLQ